MGHPSQEKYGATESCLNGDEHACRHREYRRHETTASIRGHFALYDLLELVTETGDIDITITPQPGSRSAVLFLHTSTGKIIVSLSSSFLSAIKPNLPRDYVRRNGLELDSRSTASFTDREVLDSILARNYSSLIHSNSGSIQANILLGNGADTQVSSDDGAIAMDILTTGIGASNPPSLFHTTTQSSPQIIYVNAFGNSMTEGSEITQLRSRHVSHSSNDLRIAYADQWRGRVQITVEGQGAIDVAGRSLELDIVERQRIHAHRGEGELVRVGNRGGGDVIFTNGVDFE